MIRIAGFVDAHAHLRLDDAPVGVPIDELRESGVIAAVDAGTSGARGFEAAVSTWRAQMPIRAYVNTARGGLRGAREQWEALSDDLLADLANLRPDGVKVRLGERSDGDDLGDLRRAVEASRALAVRLMVHPTNARIDPDVLLGMLQEGDVLTHCYCAGHWNILDATGRVARAAHAARARGVRFDLGRGLRHFSPDVARTALADRFAPDFVSTDRVALLRPGLHARSIGEVLAEIVALGMEPEAALAAATTSPARFYGFELPEVTNAASHVELDEAFTLVRRVTSDGNRCSS